MLHMSSDYTQKKNATDILRHAQKLIVIDVHDVRNIRRSFFYNHVLINTRFQRRSAV